MNVTNNVNTSKLLFLEPSSISSGLTKQLYFIIYGIIDCINTKKTNLKSTKNSPPPYESLNLERK